MLFVLCAVGLWATVSFIINHQKKIIQVPYISQESTLAAGCELVSATMVLEYYGFDVPVEQVVAKTPQSNLIQSKDEWIGAHPSKAFIGDPHSADGFGCYAPVITSVMNSFFEKKGEKKAVNVTGTDLETLVQNYIKQDTPVIIWATINMRAPSLGRSWTIKDTGKKFSWIAGEHCLVLVGYDKDNYYFNDPYDTHGLINYEKRLVRERFNDLGQQAVVVKNGN